VNITRPISSLLLIATLLVGTASHLQAKDYPQDMSEAQAKAAYLIQFKKYASWPQNMLPVEAPVVIGIVGAPAVEKELEARIAERPRKKRQIKLKHLRVDDSMADIHILYIGNDMAGEIGSWLARAQGLPILAVTETGDRMPAGSMINFVHDSGRIRFDVSLTAAERSQIKLSAALLTVARQVYGGKT
jgi:hypothetical protein